MAGDKTTCSAMSNEGSNSDVCSVRKPAISGLDGAGNKCSAIAMGNAETGGTATCSVILAPGQTTSNDSCSVAASMTDGTNNTMCSVYIGPLVSGEAQVGGFKCSTFDSNLTLTTGNCSVLDGSGSLVPGRGPDANNWCGGQHFKGH